MGLHLFQGVFKKIRDKRDGAFHFVWLLLMIASSMGMVWAVGKSAYNLYQFSRLSTRVEGKILTWNIKEASAGKYILKAQYRYHYNGHIFVGEQSFATPVFNNAHSAQYVLDKYKVEEWPVWVVKSRPHVSVIQREFSIKLLVQALLSMGLVIYFVWFRMYVHSMFKTDMA
ncbi:MAG: DUF3592 domain-containing protein [Simkaniaceae bacterium]|nr:DUF3592 domain-containing protein [Simkaniaceae bacterium]